MLVADDVIQLALAGRVQPSPRYHGFEHGFTIRGARRALLFAYRVEPDLRVASFGGRRHPTGWHAWCRSPEGRRFRVDFDLHADERGWLIRVVTAVEVTR